MTPGIDALPSTLCEIWMSFTVNTRESTPQPMGRMATLHTPWAMSYIDTLPEVVSIELKSAPRMPSYPIPLRTSTCLENIQFAASLRSSASQLLMSPAMSA